MPDLHRAIHINPNFWIENIMAMLGRILRDLVARPASRTVTPEKLGFVADRKNVLHVGCGAYHPDKLPRRDFPADEWNEVRLDIDAKVLPNVVASITSMPMRRSRSVDASELDTAPSMSCFIVASASMK